MKKVKSEIELIKEKLHNNSLSVLVGGGFSKNANKSFPSWIELLEDMIFEMFADEFIEYQLFKKKIRAVKKDIKNDFCLKIINKYGYLDLVEMFIKYKGLREAITLYIEERLKSLDEDKNNDLSTHKILINLPWNNIYTTNYDTIIEKAIFKLGKSGEYTTVINAEKLSIGIQKRIIKLHGSLRTDTECKTGKFGFDEDKNSHYIISKTDYEKYPERHTAFTHLMRIALLQESFCLIGFSGQDPNFVQWVKWVRDILKDKKDKVYLIDVKNSRCSKEQELFYKNYGINYIPLKKIYGKKNPKELITLFFDDLKTPINKTEKYYELWNKLEKVSLFSIDFYKLVSKISEEEKYFKIPSYRIYSKAERILRNCDLFVSELSKVRSQNKKVQILGSLSLILRNSYYNLTAIFKSDILKELIEIFNDIEYSKLRSNDKNKWLSFALCLLRDYRYCLRKTKFNRFSKKILNIKFLQIDIINEVKYEQALFSFIEFDNAALIKKLENWVINNESDVWSYIRKSMLLNLLNIPKYKEEILELINKSINRTNVGQEKLWFYEILLNYDISKNFTQNAYYKAQINLLKSKGHYTLEDIIEGFTKENSNKKIEPPEDKRYTISYSFGLNSKKSVNWKSVKFIELVLKAGLPLVPNIKYPVIIVNREIWWEIYKDIETGMPKEALAISIQYSGDSADEKFARSISQNLMFNQTISIKTKSEIFKKVSASFIYLYEKQDIYRPAYIYIISEIIGCLEYYIWKDFIIKLWNLQSDNTKILAQKFYTTIWGINKAISKFLPYIEDNILLNKMLQSFYALKNISKNDNIELNALKYIEKIIYHNSSFKILDSCNKAIKDTIESILQEKTISSIEMIKIYYYNLKLSNDLKESIKKKLFTLELTDNLLINWEILLELSDNDEIINNNIRAYILKNENIIFRTGISNDGRNRSFGGMNFNISDTVKKEDIKFQINWTEENINVIYIKLKRSLNLLEQYINKSRFNLELDDDEILNDMYDFLVSNLKILKEDKGYDKTVEKVKQLLSKYEVGDIENALLSSDANKIQKAIIQLSNNYEKQPKEHNEIEFTTLLMKILRKEEPKLEVAIAHLSYILTKIIKNETWIKKYNRFYLEILKNYHQSTYENLDRIYIEYQLIKIAVFLKETLTISDPIIDTWLEKKENSEFLMIKKME